jgi:hypothetical protein
MIAGILISFLVALVISLLWTNGIHNMHKNFPEYKGEDLFGEQNDTGAQP